MNQQQQLLAFAYLSASQNERSELTSKDVMAALYILSAEVLYSRSSDATKVDTAFAEFCNIDEPLWFIRMRYFVEIYFSPTGHGILNVAPGQFGKALKEFRWEPEGQSVVRLLKALSDRDVSVMKTLADATVSLDDPEVLGPK